MRLIVYSHDAFGLGNICRMLAICKYLLNTVPELSILLISGSPVLHSFRMPAGLDYIKLPCMGRNESGELSATYLKTNLQEAAKLRSDLIKAAVINFKPDLLLVDKKPYGLQGELKASIDYLKTNLPETKLVLLLRDILDAPEVTIKEWHQQGYYQALQQDYDRILVVGMSEIFDVTQEYQFPLSLCQKTEFCGYIRREYGCQRPEVIRQQLNVQPDEKLVLVTPGGGGDGYRLVETYLQGLAECNREGKIKTLIISGPEMPPNKRKEIFRAVRHLPHVQISEFTDDLASYMEAADAVICMGGYNTICEVLSLSKKAVVVPRVNPVQEQWIRAERMADFGLFQTIHPDDLTPQSLMNAVLGQLQSDNRSLPPVARLDLQALPRISYSISNLVYGNPNCSSNLQFKLSEIIELYPLRAAS
ncbi:MAG: glycosyltransferase [Cyanosarcina radialis HA8281-LM2]|nr:glycosyltransferase [Cyanosarcina radialis HA8281-LM2]